jgi:integrase
MGTLEDFQHFERRLQKELDRLDEFTDTDRPRVKRFVEKKDGDVTDGTLATYLRNLRMAARAHDQPLVELDEATMDALTYELRHGNYGHGGDGYSNDSIRNIEFAVRAFLKVIDGHAWAADYELTSPADSKVRPEDMLRGEDINALTSAAHNLRDVALIEFLADTGVRLSLVGSLRVGDVDLEGPKATYTPNPNARGLKGAAIRDYPIIDAKGVLRSYVRQTHPRPDRDDVALFHCIPGHGNPIDGDGALTPTAIRNQLRRAADNAGLDKPVNPHNFRHSAITRMRREGYDRGEIESRVHWTVDSDMWATYEHIASAEHNQAIWERAGVVEDDDGPEPERRPCGTCMEPVAPHHDYCQACGAAVSKRARDLEDEGKDDLDSDLVVVEMPDGRKRVVETRQIVDAEPERLDADHASNPSE